MKKSNPQFFLFPILFAFAMLMAVQNISAQSAPYMPEKGSTERKAILDGIRKYRKAPNEVYSPTDFKVQNGWAFVAAPDPSDPEVDTMSFNLLLQRTGKIWRVVDNVSHVEGSDYDREIKRIRRKFPKAPAGIFE